MQHKKIIYYITFILQQQKYSVSESTTLGIQKYAFI